MLDEYYIKKKVGKYGGAGMKKAVLSEEQKRIERLRNIKSTVSTSMRHDPYLQKKLNKKVKKQRRDRAAQQMYRQQEAMAQQITEQQYYAAVQASNASGSRPGFDLRPSLGSQYGISKNGLHAKKLRDTDYIKTEKQMKQMRRQQQQQQQQQSSMMDNSSLPQLPPSGGYLDEASLTSEQLAMQLPRFEVGMTDRTIPESEKKARVERARKQQEEAMAYDEETGQSALDLMQTPRDEEGEAAIDVLLQSNSTGKKKKKKRRVPMSKSAGNIGYNDPQDSIENPSAISKTARREREHNDENRSPMRGRMRPKKKMPLKNRQQPQQEPPQQVKKSWDPNYRRPWRDNAPEKKVRRVRRDSEEMPSVFHPRKSQGLYKSSTSMVLVDDEEDPMLNPSYPTPISKRVKKAKANLKPKGKGINELKSEYAEALNILRDVVERMQEQGENEQEGLSPMLKRRFGDELDDRGVEDEIDKGHEVIGNFAEKMAMIDEVLDSPKPRAMKEIDNTDTHHSLYNDREEEDEDDDEGFTAFGSSIEKDDGYEGGQGADEGGRGEMEVDGEVNGGDDVKSSGKNEMDFSSKQQTLDDYNEWWRKQQSLPGAEIPPQIELGGLGAVSPTRNDLSGISDDKSSVDELQEQIKKMQLIIDSQEEKIDEMKLIIAQDSPQRDPDANVHARAEVTPPSSIRRKSRFAVEDNEGKTGDSVVSERRRSSVQFSPKEDFVPETVAASSVEPVSFNSERRRSSVKDRPPTPIKWAKIDLDASDDEDDDDEEVEEVEEVEKVEKVDEDAEDDKHETDAQIPIQQDSRVEEYAGERRRSSITFGEVSPIVAGVTAVSPKSEGSGSIRRKSKFSFAEPQIAPDVKINVSDEEVDEEDDEDDEEEADSNTQKDEAKTSPRNSVVSERRRSSVQFSPKEEVLPETAVPAPITSFNSERRRSSVKDRPPTPIKWAKIDLDASDEDDEEEDEEEQVEQAMDQEQAQQDGTASEPVGMKKDDNAVDEEEKLPASTVAEVGEKRKSSISFGEVSPIAPGVSAVSPKSGGSTGSIRRKSRFNFPEPPMAPEVDVEGADDESDEEVEKPSSAIAGEDQPIADSNAEVEEKLEAEAETNAKVEVEGAEASEPNGENIVAVESVEGGVDFEEKETVELVLLPGEDKGEDDNAGVKLVSNAANEIDIVESEAAADVVDFRDVGPVEDPEQVDHSGNIDYPEPVVESEHLSHPEPAAAPLPEAVATPEDIFDVDPVTKPASAEHAGVDSELDEAAKKSVAAQSEVEALFGNIEAKFDVQLDGLGGFEEMTNMTKVFTPELPLDTDNEVMPAKDDAVAVPPLQLPVADEEDKAAVDLEESLGASLELSTAAPIEQKQAPVTQSKSQSVDDRNAEDDDDEIEEDPGVILTDRSEGLGGKIYRPDGTYTTTTENVDREVAKLTQQNITSPEHGVIADEVAEEEDEDDYYDEEDSFEDDVEDTKAPEVGAAAK